jgi:hypothetical protein
MLDKFIKENWKYVPYKRKKIEYSEIIKNLEERLNSDGAITEIVKNIMLPFEMEIAKKKTGAAITSSKLYLANALMYSNGAPINLDIYEKISVWPFNPFFGYDIDRGNLTLQMNYFSSADKKDIEFIHKCLRGVRFEEYKK